MIVPVDVTKAPHYLGCGVLNSLLLSSYRRCWMQFEFLSGACLTGSNSEFFYCLRRRSQRFLTSISGVAIGLVCVFSYIDLELETDRKSPPFCHGPPLSVARPTRASEPLMRTHIVFVIFLIPVVGDCLTQTCTVDTRCRCNRFYLSFRDQAPWPGELDIGVEDHVCVYSVPHGLCGRRV